MLKRAIAVCIAVVATIAALGGCEVTQINWANHFYTVSTACASPAGSVTLRNGTGVFAYPDPYRLTGVGHARVTVVKTIYGDFTADGVNDVANVLVCTDADGGNAYGAEIQVFTRNGTPLQRLTPPGTAYPYGNAPEFDVRSIVDHPFWGVHNLIAGVYSYAPNDPRCCPSYHSTYWFQWNSMLKTFLPTPWNGFP